MNKTVDEEFAEVWKTLNELIERLEELKERTEEKP